MSSSNIFGPPESVEIYRIIYDASQINLGDQGFLILDNTSNDRPDWAEFWPIRKFFIEHPVIDHNLYGFLSPRFYEKTGLTSENVKNFIFRSDHDVYSFSPEWDQAIFSINVFEQAVANHPGIQDAFIRMFGILGIKLSPFQIVMTSRESIFSNYFVAKGWVWREWFRMAERIFEAAEMELARRPLTLCKPVKHRGINDYQAKVFIIERLICLLLWRFRQIKVAQYNIWDHLSKAKTSQYAEYFLLLNALKSIFVETNQTSFIKDFYSIRSQLFIG